MTNAEGPQILEPVHAADDEADGKRWSYRLVVFLRVMAAISLCKGLYHWAIICGIGAPFPSGFDSYSTPYQVATVFFAIIDPVAGVGLWLAAPWGAVVWLTSVISMAAVELLFPQIYGGNMWVVVVDVLLLGIYLGLALMAARQQPGGVDSNRGGGRHGKGRIHRARQYGAAHGSKSAQGRLRRDGLRPQRACDREA